jgi:hypothetical protein
MNWMGTAILVSWALALSVIIISCLVWPIAYYRLMKTEPHALPLPLVVLGLSSQAFWMGLFMVPPVLGLPTVLVSIALRSHLPESARWFAWLTAACGAAWFVGGLLYFVPLALFLFSAGL